MTHLWVFLTIFLVTSSAIGVSHGAEKVVKVDSFDWSYVTSPKESSSTSSLTIKLMANIARRCDSVSGKNLWKVGVFGSESQDGSGERYSYVEQILNKKQTCKTVNRGSVFKLRDLRTSFDVDEVSCGDASFLCVELAKNRDSSVNFELRYGGLVNSVVACKPLECTDPSILATERNDVLPICINSCPAEEVSSGVVCGNNSVEYDNLCELRKAARCENVPVQLGNLGMCAPKEKVVKVDSFDWSYVTSPKESSSTSSLTIKLMANIARRCDSVSGKNLWKVGVFGSESQDGSGERYSYVEQILNKKQTCKTVKKGSVFKLRDLRTSFDVDEVSCGDASFLCVELAKNRDSSVNFELRYGGFVNSVVACKPLECTNPSISATERNDVLPICINSCPAEEVSSGVVCGNNSVEYDNLCELRKAARCENVSVQLGNLGKCAPKEFFINSYTWRYYLVRNYVNSSLPFLANKMKFITSGDDDLTGNDLWQVSFFRSDHKWGWENRRHYQQQVINRTLSSQSISRNRSLDFVLPFNRYAIGCEQSPYLCFTFRRNPNASVDFKLNFTWFGISVYTGCISFPCSQMHYKAWILLSYVWVDVSFINSRSAGIRELAIKINLQVHRISDRVVRGRNMWLLSVYGSRNATGYEPEKLGYTSVALNSNDTNYSPDIIPGQTTVFPNITTAFDGSGIGCGDYRYICIELERDPNSEPDFEVTRCVNRKRIMACDRQYTCLD